MELPCDPTILFLGVYLENMKAHSKVTCTPIFTVVLFTIVQTWTQPKCLSTSKWIKNMQHTHTHTHTHTMKYYSAIRNKEIMPFAVTWIDSQIITLSEISQTKTNNISLICGI